MRKPRFTIASVFLAAAMLALAIFAIAGPSSATDEVEGDDCPHLRVVQQYERRFLPLNVQEMLEIATGPIDPSPVLAEQELVVWWCHDGDSVSDGHITLSNANEIGPESLIQNVTIEESELVKVGNAYLVTSIAKTEFCVEVDASYSGGGNVSAAVGVPGIGKVNVGSEFKPSVGVGTRMCYSRSGTIEVILAANGKFELRASGWSTDPTGRNFLVELRSGSFSAEPTETDGGLVTS